MSSTKENWEEVLSRIEGLGLKLKYHLESEQAETAAEDAAEVAEAAVEEVVDADASAESPNELQSLIDGVEKFVEMIDDAFDAIGKASKDAAVRDDFRDIGESLRNAMASTWNDAGADLREILTRPKKDMADMADDALVGEIIDPDAADDDA